MTSSCLMSPTRGSGVCLAVRFHRTAFLLVGSRQVRLSSTEYGIECRNGRVGCDAADATSGGPSPVDDLATRSPTWRSSCSPAAGSTRSASTTSPRRPESPAARCFATTRRRTRSRGAISTPTCSTCATCSRPSIPAVPIEQALRDALLAFNTFDESETARHRLRMQVILRTTELQAYSMTMYAGWRDVIAEFVARRLGRRPTIWCRRRWRGRCSASRCRPTSTGWPTSRCR